MSHPSVHARTDPAKAALIVADTGETITYAELDTRSNRAAQMFRARGLAVGDTIALLLENTPEFYDITWGAQRAGLFYVCISTKLTAPEAEYILRDSGARLMVASASLTDMASGLAGELARFSVSGAIAGWDAWEDAVAAMPSTPIADERAGTDMLYSSGTTGRPKGVRVALPEDPDIGAPTVLGTLGSALYGLGPDSIYLSPAPLYHAAPLRWSMTVHRLGGTVVMMQHFDPQAALAAIERYAVTASQWVPTHFVRMLKLDEAARNAHDLSSLKVAIHAAAPCPVPVKEAMIAWWGPVLYEYYAGSEGNGLTTINSEQWLTHKGSVGKAAYGVLHICGEDGTELPPGSEGLIYFEGGGAFEYHNDPAKTAEARNALGWSTLGDIGRIDDDGYLFLTDRIKDMVVSGAENIYPAEVEAALRLHPSVADVVVFGQPDERWGEIVVAAIELRPGLVATDDDLRQHARETLAGYKVPKRFIFDLSFPRTATGKVQRGAARIAALER